MAQKLPTSQFLATVEKYTLDTKTFPQLTIPKCLHVSWNLFFLKNNSSEIEASIAAKLTT